MIKISTLFQLDSVLPHVQLLYQLTLLTLSFPTSSPTHIADLTENMTASAAIFDASSDKNNKEDNSKEIKTTSPPLNVSEGAGVSETYYNDNSNSKKL